MPGGDTDLWERQPVASTPGLALHSFNERVITVIDLLAQRY